MIKNWKTTVSGVLSIVVALSSYFQSYLDVGAFGDIGPVVAAIVAGVGLIVAGDAKKE